MPSPLTIQPDATAGKDCALVNDDPTSCYGANSQLYCGVGSAGAGKLRRSLVAFDVSAVPAGATVTNVVASLWEHSAGGSVPGRTLSMYRVLRNWVEAQATWNIYSTGNNWGTAGCAHDDVDAVSTASADNATFTSTASNGFKDWGSTAGLVSDVQSWVSGTKTNYGWIVVSGAEGEVQGYNDFRSSDYYATQPTWVPKLVVTYTEGFIGMLVTRKVG